MDGTSLLTFVRYHAWANDRVLTTAAQLTDEEFRRPDVLDLGSAFDTVRHLDDVDWSWREFCVGNDVGPTYAWDLYPLEDLPALHAFSIGEGKRLRALVESLSDDELAEPWGTKENFKRPRWLVISHIVSHGTQHRSELARYFTQCGHSPGDLDEILNAHELPWPSDAKRA